MICLRARVVLGVAVVAWLGQVQPIQAQAQSPQEGITVVGTGTVQAKPNTVEIVGSVRGEAELAGDALVKYRDSKRRAVEAIQGLKIEGLTVEGTGFKIDSGGGAANMQALILGGQQPAVAPKVSVSEPLTITIKNIESVEDEELGKQIIQIIDAGKDAGITIGAGTGDPRTQLIQMQMGMATSSGLATFKLVGADESRQAAYEQAMTSAKKNAERLAQLAGVKLGKVASISEHANPAAARQTVVLYNFGGDSASNEPTYQSDSFKNIPVTVTLAVRFEIE